MKFLNGFLKTEVPSEMIDDKLLLSETTHASTETRKVTDKWFLFVFGASVLVSLPFFIYTLHKSDINRWNGFDACGNICGQKNVFDPNIECSGKDYTDKPYYNYFGCEVMPSWRQYDYPQGINQQFSIFAGVLVMASLLPLGILCIRDNFKFYKPKGDIGWWVSPSRLSFAVIHLVIVTIVTAGLALLLAAGFRYAPCFTVVGLLVISWGYLVAASFLSPVMWYGFFFITVLPIIFAVLALIMLCVMIYARDRIKMAIMLFKESTKALSNIQMLAPVPVMTWLMAIALVVISGKTYMHMSTAGILQNTPNPHNEYVPNGFIIAAIVLNIVLTEWVVLVLLGLQNMTISSAVAKWYSSRGPVTTDYCTILKHHLGSAFLGSIVINIVSVPRSILIGLSQISIIKDMVDCVLRCLNGFHYSYIITASQGRSFFKSSKQARQVLNLKIGDTTGAKYLGSFVMFLCPILVIWVSTVFYVCVLDRTFHYTYIYNYSSTYSTISSYFVIMVSFLSCYILLAPIQVAYDTLFMCACEDILKEGHQHDSMSIEEFHSNAADVIEKKVKGTSQPNTTLDAVVQ